MKKTIIAGLILAIISTFGLQAVNAKPNEQESINIIKGAIGKYKDKNYIGCISDLKLHVADDPTSAISWYYLGNAYMNIAMKTEAHVAFDRVVQINSVPKLTSYALQAKICMENPVRCDYQNFTYDEINQLKADPMTFIEQYFATLNNEAKDANEVEIERLINGYYSNNMHPSAKDFIMQERAKIRQLEMNANKASLDDGIKTAMKSNNDVKALAMMLETPSARNTNYYQPQDINSMNHITPQMLQSMIMSNMMMMPE